MIHYTITRVRWKVLSPTVKKCDFPLKATLFVSVISLPRLERTLSILSPMYSVWEVRFYKIVVCDRGLVYGPFRVFIGYKESAFQITFFKAGTRPNKSCSFPSANEPLYAVLNVFAENYIFFFTPNVFRWIFAYSEAGQQAWSTSCP